MSKSCTTGGNIGNIFLYRFLPPFHPSLPSCMERGCRLWWGIRIKAGGTGWLGTGFRGVLAQSILLCIGICIDHAHKGIPNLISVDFGWYLRWNLCRRSLRWSSSRPFGWSSSEWFCWNRCNIFIHDHLGIVAVVNMLNGSSCTTWNIVIKSRSLPAPQVIATILVSVTILNEINVCVCVERKGVRLWIFVVVTNNQVSTK